MKKLLLLLLLFVAYGCKKDSSNQPKGQLEFDLVGLRDIVIEQSDTLEIPFEVKYLKGVNSTVTVVPISQFNKMSVLISNMQGVPSFNSVLRLVSFGQDTGEYVLTVRTSWTDLSNPPTKDYSISLKVVPNPVNPALAILGNYVETGSCSGAGSISHSVVVSEVKPFFNRINIKGLYAGGSFYNIKADIDPANQTLVIFPQEDQGMTFVGVGNYAANQISLNYQLSDGMISDSCYTLLSK